MFKKILIANRGEIACRVIRTCRRLGIATVAVYSEADARAQHVRLADEAYAIGGPRPAESYLRGDAIIEVAKRSGAEAIHPGYGFLSENAAFARAIKAAGLSFIGPAPESMEQMGSKAGAKALMIAHGVPTVPGYHGENQDTEFLQEQAQTTGFPLMIKATSGGGGKGMRIVRSADEFVAALQSAQREAQSSFGDQRVILERYVEHPRHIEFQVFGDSHGNVIHLNERECSAQRRYQKVLEETPSPFLNTQRRQAMGEAAVAAARAVNYLGAGTIEFIVAQDGSFFFMEMNTRLQVEHPVTELTLGLDLVEWQLRIAAGEVLPLQQTQIHARGHAIELRLYAEDPEQNFLPGSGKLEQLRLPAPSANVRIDSGVIEGDTVSIFYDPMITKLIVWDTTRELALTRLREALAESEIVGPKSNIEFLEKLVRHPVVVEGRIDTGYLDRHLDEFVSQAQTPHTDILFAAATAALLHEEASSVARAATGSDPHSPWQRADAWRIGHAGKRVVAFLWRGERIEITAHGSVGNYALDCAEHHCDVRAALLQNGWLSAAFNGIARRLRCVVSAQRVMVHDSASRYVLQHVGAFAYVASAQKVGDRITAPMPGRIVLVKVAPGDAVDEGQELLVMEAMKMEITLRAPRAASIETVQAQPGEFVEADSVLIKLVKP
ncbi:acetyl/propionyl/methylcrotonyl-CoA carboxylase subunit alpha [Pseudolysobacter antarcticus]|uniref:Biotin carboxylase n=1 Tax=Pseudolysobacter antarcticus TaxID=2511995 RepID=A0A411HI67_9GAMM|nr:acetyl/propionyl/methylcrotonyl-CoA carboxylase subunit alpha [Pseudolysobacter antarcticus]QBB70219.1 acetyl/propionyl/methylcrotonyl-CoA carboxylase subunit alpha [Pseudolysobacter antarcticus]